MGVKQVDQYITEAKLNTSAYLRGAQQLIQANHKIAQSQKGTSTSGVGGGGGSSANSPAIGAGLGSTSDILSGAASAAVQFVAAYVGVVSAITAGSIAASRQAGDFDALTKSLEAVEGNAKAAREEMKRLYELAKAPGIGFEEAVGSYTKLRNNGLSSGFSETVLKEVANANALSGGGAEKFGNLMRAISELSGQDFLQGDELRQLEENGLPARRLVRQQFGTSDTNELKKMGVTSQQVIRGLVEQLAKFPRVGDSVKNQWDNFDQNMKLGVTQFGQGFNESIMGLFGDANKSLETALAGGLFKSLGDHVASALQEALGGASAEEAIINATAGAHTFIDVLEMIGAGLKAALSMIGSATGVAGAILTPIIKDTFDAHKRGAEADFETGKLNAARDKKAQEIGDAARKKQEETEGEKKTNTALKQIEKHTQKASDVLSRTFDKNQRIIGGGQVGGIGLTALEVGGLRRRSHGGGSHAAVVGAMSGLVDAIFRAANEAAEKDATYRSRASG